MKVKYKSVNSIAVSDDNLIIMIHKKPKQRYRTIIRAFYKRIHYRGMRTCRKQN